MEPAPGRPRILFVDDEPAILRGIRNALRKDAVRWELEFAVGAAEAISRMETVAFRVVVTDARMAGLDGSAVLAAAAARLPGARRVVLTGHVEEEALAHLRGMAHEILLKPCSPDELRAAVERGLG